MPDLLPLTSLRRTDLAQAGGKGANLGELLAAGLPVPPGFCVLTGAYRAFVEDNGLEEEIQRRCAAADPARPETLEAASAAIRAAFAAGKMADELEGEICAAYRALGGEPGQGEPLHLGGRRLLEASAEPRGAALSVAVRSSATAEDLPDLSFAGQQDTYLNVVGEQALLEAVVRCWASLWTARAIGYRARNAISQAGVALAVVVQAMIPSEAAGVLFTADPLSGRRDRLVIDATLGLGEALVAGKVEPDHYVVGQGLHPAAPPGGFQITEKFLGSKALSIRGQTGGGTQTVAEQAGETQALPDAAILALAALGRRAETHFGGPQDMEWSWAGEKLWVVQSRPVTSLYPLPENKRGADHLLVLFNFGTFQGMMEPISPLGRDTFRYLFSSMSRVFGAQWTPTSQPLLYEAGERLFLDLNGLLRHPFGRKAVGLALPAVEPASAQALAPYRDDPRLPLGDGRLSMETRLHLARALGPNALRVIANLLFPAARRRRITTKTNQVVRDVQAERVAAEGNPPDPLRLIEFYEQSLWKLPPRMLLWLVSMVVSGQVAYQGLRKLIGALPESGRLGLEVMRGLEHNVTTEMDLALWGAAQAIRRDPSATKYFQSQPAQLLAADYQAGRMPPAAQTALAVFLDRYGMRGIGEIDLGRRRWREDPTPVMQSLISYLKIDRLEAAPDAVFARGATSGRQAVAQISAGMRGEPGGWWKAPLAGWLAGRARELAGLRETPKFTIIRVFGELRTALLAAGAAWVQAGWLEQAEDVFFFRIAELKQLAIIAHGAPPADNPWRGLVEERRAAYQREQRRRQVPRLVIGDGTTIYDGMGGSGVLAGEKVLVGSPVSPGLVEGVAHVVLDPFGAQLAPGEILVCPGTDPAWTPLFLAAGGLVMEVGGLMTHGSVVAREYGIPAVVGVGQATQRLKTGTRLRLDGSSGTVTILE